MFINMALIYKSGPGHIYKSKSERYKIWHKAVCYLNFRGMKYNVIVVCSTAKNIIKTDFTCLTYQEESVYLWAPG